MEISGAGKSPNASLSFRYNANNEELEELFNACDDDPPTPQFDAPLTSQSENASPKRGDKSASILDKYFKSMRTEKSPEKSEDVKATDVKEEPRSSTPKEITSSPMKEYLNRLGKRSTSEVVTDSKDSNETWKIFHDFKFKIAQAVEDMKTRSVEDTKEKSVPRENSMSDSEENSATKDIDQQSVGDTDNQVSSLDSSMQNLSELTQPLTAKATERESSLPNDSENHSIDDTHKNLARSDSADLSKDLLDSNMLDVESGVEALEDSLDGFGATPQLESETVPSNCPADSTTPPTVHAPPNYNQPPSKTNLNQPPSKTNQENVETSKQKNYFLNLSMYLLTLFVFFNFILFPRSHVWNGFITGLWFFYFASNVKEWLLDNYFSEEPKGSYFQLKRSGTMPTTYTIPSVKEHTPLKKYEGWINHYRYPDYDPYVYHINKTATAFMKLEGCNLRISYTKTKISKRALWSEKIENIVFYQHRLYNLTGARVILLPKGLVRRRQWSKKYPICIILSEKEKIQVLEKESSPNEKKAESSPEKKSKEIIHHDVESTETNTSPEKKRKFIWRRKEKSISHSDGEVEKEGLRQRLVKKIHKDKKTDSTSTCTEPEKENQPDRTIHDDAIFHDAETELATKSATSTKEDDEEFDDTELSRIKDFLEEAELDVGHDGAAEGEWSIHVKPSKDKHSHLYLFTRTGRDKIEWYRRLTTAITEANASSESSTAEDKSSDPVGEKDIEVSVYKVSDSNTVTFAKNMNKSSDLISEGVTISTSSKPVAGLDSYEKNFWPYLLKIIQQNKTPHTCECRILPAEVSWVNTLLARLMYDVMSDPVILTRLQKRIQRKLLTLKLPSFMSPLMVEELSLRGASPLLQRVAAPRCDERGVWLDADLRYDGGAYITLLTQINLMKLKKKNMTLEEQLLEATDNLVENDLHTSTAGTLFSEKQLRKRKPAIYDSDVEDSAESSSDDDSPPVQPVDSTENIQVAEPIPGPAAEGRASISSKKKFLRMVDKIATNKYFQQVTDYKYVKRAMEGLSNTDIKLQLEVQGLEGRLAFNLPSPPHDRIWIGFRTNPQLVLKARPAVGARALRFAHISNWIEQKLSKEFEKVLVLPNMEDIIVDIMTPTPVDFE